MQRYFIKEEQIYIENGLTLIKIDEQDSHHIKDVMRMRVGENVIACLEDSTTVYFSEVMIVSKNVILKVLKEEQVNNELDIKVSIAHGLVKKDKQEEVIRRLVELGAYAYIPVAMDRSVIKLNKSEYHFTNPRLERIVKEASEQSERNSLLKLEDVIAFNDLVKNFDNYDLVLFASAKDKDNLSLKEKLNINKDTKNILVLVGPEGGFSDKETEMIEKSKAYTISLGKRVLRTETAPLCAMSILGFLAEGDK